MAKKNLKLRNPFIYQGYVSPVYFCDRTEETEELIANLQNGRNTVLISPRRIGKTGLIKNAFYHILEQEKDAKCLYIDIFAPTNESSSMTVFIVHSLFVFIVLALSIWLIVWLCKDSQPGENKWGPNPKEVPSESNSGMNY